jgi:hypothetical protein
MHSDHKIYKTSSAGFIALVIATATIFASYMLDGNYIKNKIFFVYIALLVFAAVDTKYGIYVGLERDSFFEVKHFFIRREIRIADIHKIFYQPTWIIGQKMRSVYLIDAKNNKIKIKMSNAAFPIATLSAIIADLKRKNPNIQLDESARQLIDSFNT